MLELLLAALAELLQQVLQARHALAVLVLSALAEQPLQRAPQVALFEQVVAHGLEQRLGVEVEDVLGAVPGAVAEDVRHCWVPPLVRSAAGG